MSAAARGFKEPTSTQPLFGTTDRRLPVAPADSPDPASQEALGNLHENKKVFADYTPRTIARTLLRSTSAADSRVLGGWLRKRGVTPAATYAARVQQMLTLLTRPP